VLVGGSVGTRRRQQRYSWEAVGGRQRIGIGHLVQNSQFNSFVLQHFLSLSACLACISYVISRLPLRLYCSLLSLSRCHCQEYGFLVVVSSYFFIMPPSIDLYGFQGEIQLGFRRCRIWVSVIVVVS
jgi:hypothetical protein